MLTIKYMIKAKISAFNINNKTNITIHCTTRIKIVNRVSTKNSRENTHYPNFSFWYVFVTSY